MNIKKIKQPFLHKHKLSLVVSLSLLVLLFVVPFTFATQTQGHPASEVAPGTFSSGNFVFPDSVSVNDAVLVEGTTSLTFLQFADGSLQQQADPWIYQPLNESVSFDFPPGIVRIHPEFMGIGTSDPQQRIDIGTNLPSGNEPIVNTPLLYFGYYGNQTTAAHHYRLDTPDNSREGAVYVDASGRVGINHSRAAGSSTPWPTLQATVDVKGNVRTIVSGYDNGGVTFPDGSTQTTVPVLTGGPSHDGHSLDAVDNDPTNVVYVDADGDVGIGTNAPQEKLHVVGQIRSGNVCENQVCLNSLSPGQPVVTGGVGDDHSLDAADSNPADALSINPSGKISITGSPYSNAFSSANPQMVLGTTTAAGEVINLGFGTGNLFQAGARFSYGSQPRLSFSASNDGSVEFSLPGVTVTEYGVGFNDTSWIQSVAASVQGNIKATGTVCDGSGNCVGTIPRTSAPSVMYLRGEPNAASVPSCPSGWTEAGQAQIRRVFTFMTNNQPYFVRTCYRNNGYCETMVLEKKLNDNTGSSLPSCPSGWSSTSLESYPVYYNPGLFTMYKNQVRVCYLCNG